RPAHPPTSPGTAPAAPVSPSAARHRSRTNASSDRKTSTYANPFASTPPTIHSPAKLPCFKKASIKPTDSSDASGRGTTAQLSRCHDQANSSHVTARPIHAVAVGEQNRV